MCCYVAIGIPFPHTNDLSVKLKREYNDMQNRKSNEYVSGKTWYNLPVYRSLGENMYAHTSIFCEI